MVTQQKVRTSGHSGVMMVVFGMALAAVLASGLFIGLRQPLSSSGQAVAPAAGAVVPDAVTGEELRALKEAQAEARAVAVAALPDAVTGEELRALKEAQAEARAVVVAALPDAVTGEELRALKEARADQP